MTNKEYIIKGLSGESYEVIVHYYIKCPYRCGDKRAHCNNGSKDGCVACKKEWLESEVDK